MKILEQTSHKINWKTCSVFLLLILCITNVLQIYFTEITHDEAYYSLYGENLAWGYFDHPPMIGLMTFISDFFFSDNMSVRFITLVFQILTILVIWKIIGEKKPNTNKIILFSIIVSSTIMFTAYGFITTPDVPLLFFSSLFLWFYKRFLKETSWLNIILLSVSMAGMMYSKYHAVLIIGLIVLSNLKLLGNYKFWISCILALTLLLPHILWQVENDFPSFKYHLIGRSSEFSWRYFLEYIPHQLLIFNPFAFGLIIYLILKDKAQTPFERSLYFLIIGFIFFFWLTSFRGHVEPHWTVVCSIPMIIIIYNKCVKDKKIRKFTLSFFIPIIFLSIIARIILTTEMLPKKLDFYGKERLNKSIEQVAGNLPVVFTGSYQAPSNYHYFTKQEALLLSGVNTRITQFDIWQNEVKYNGKKVFIYSSNHSLSKEYNVNNQKFKGFFCDSLQTANRMKIDFSLDSQTYKPGDTIRLEACIYNPYKFDIDFNHPQLPISVKAAYRDKKTFKLLNCGPLQPLNIVKSGGSLSGKFITIVPEVPKGEYKFTLSLYNTLCPAINSTFTKITIHQKEDLQGS